MDSVYLNDWKESGQDGIISDFGIDSSALKGAEVLIASYTYEDYSGSAFVLFRKDGKLFEVNGGHCSCYGLAEKDYCGDNSTQWEPEETTVEALLHRIDTDYNFDGFREELRSLLSNLGASKS